jgi:hypothetical protein
MEANTSEVRGRILSALSVNNAWDKIQVQIYFRWSFFLGGGLFYDDVSI